MIQNIAPDLFKGWETRGDIHAIMLFLEKIKGLTIVFTFTRTKKDTEPDVAMDCRGLGHMQSHFLGYQS
jgi:hypothetical protein